MSIEKRIKVLLTASVLASNLLFSGCATRYFDYPTNRPTDEMIANRGEIPKVSGFLLYRF